MFVIQGNGVEITAHIHYIIYKHTTNHNAVAWQQSAFKYQFYLLHPFLPAFLDELLAKGFNAMRNIFAFKYKFPLHPNLF